MGFVEQEDTLQQLAETALLHFLSGDFQAIKRSVFVNDEFKVSDLIDDRINIIRVCESTNAFEWFILIQEKAETHLFRINTPINMGSLEPRVSGYPISEVRVLEFAEITSLLSIDELQNLIGLSEVPEKFDLVFSGSSDQSPSLMATSKLRPVFN